jgi:putative membrane protein
MKRTIRGTILRASCIGAFAAVALFVCGGASAQMGRGGGGYGPSSSGSSDYPQGPNLGQGTPNSNAMSDAEFAKEAAESGLAGMKFGQLGQDKGSSDAVKEFGKKMAADQMQAMAQLKAIADKGDLKLPTDLNKRDQKNYDKLSQMSGDAFDKAYMKEMVKDDQDHVSMFQLQANGGQNGTIRNFAAQTLPVLQDQLKLAKDTSKALAGEKGGTSKSASN